MNKKTRIVATIGPATESKETIEQLILSGMNVARFNTKHGTPEWHTERIQRVRDVSEQMKLPIGILLDLQGPEIRITIPGGNSFPVQEGENVIFTSDETMANEKTPVIPKVVIDTLSEGDHVLIDDGLGEFAIVGKSDSELVATALSSFVVNNRKTLNTPGVTIDLPSLIEQDFIHLDSAKNELIDFVGLSFVRNAQDILILRKELQKRNLTADIISKIENQSSLDHLEEIIEVSDAIMIARGDLAVEVHFNELTFWQKRIIELCRQYGKPVITATQMLKSMVEHPRPTRAEVSDVAHAIYDGTDAVMLSEETTIGEYPVQAVKAQASIANFNEPHTQFLQLDAKYSGTSTFITRAAVGLIQGLDTEASKPHIDKIICLTESGLTARHIARFRPKIPMYVLTSRIDTFRKLSLLYGITPHVIDLPQDDKLESSQVLLEKMLYLKIVQSGETILLVHGTFWKRPGLTNTITIIKIP